MLLEAEAQEREQGWLVRHNPSQNMVLARRKGLQHVGEDLPWGKPLPQSTADLLRDTSLVTLPDAMLFAGSDTLCSPRTTFSLAQHFHQLPPHSHHQPFHFLCRILTGTGSLASCPFSEVMKLPSAPLLLLFLLCQCHSY